MLSFAPLSLPLWVCVGGWFKRVCAWVCVCVCECSIFVLMCGLRVFDFRVRIGLSTVVPLMQQWRIYDWRGDCV